MIVILFGALAAADEPGFHFTSPEDGALLLGETAFCFDVDHSSADLDRIDVYVAGRLVGSAKPSSWCTSWQAPAGSSGAAIVGIAYRGNTVMGRQRISSLAVDFGREINVAAVQLYPAVVDQRGHYVHGLSRADFSVLDQGERVAIEGFAEEPATLTITLLLDTSSSMFDRMGLVKDAAYGFVDGLEQEDRVAVAAFHHAIRHVTPPTTDRGLAKEGIRKLDVGGGTAVYDALIAALAESRKATGRRALFLFSDGLDERSIATLADAVRAAHQANAIVYAVGSGEDYWSLKARDDLRLLAEETGGQAHFVRRLADLPEVFDAVLAHLRSQYVLSYTPPPGPTGLRRVEVSITRSGMQVLCRSSYMHQDEDGGSLSSSTFSKRQPQLNRLARMRQRIPLFASPSDSLWMHRATRLETTTTTSPVLRLPDRGQRRRGGNDEATRRRITPVVSTNDADPQPGETTTEIPGV